MCEAIRESVSMVSVSACEDGYYENKDSCSMSEENASLVGALGSDWVQVWLMKLLCDS